MNLKNDFVFANNSQDNETKTETGTETWTKTKQLKQILQGSSILAPQRQVQLMKKNIPTMNYENLTHWRATREKTCYIRKANDNTERSRLFFVLSEPKKSWDELVDRADIKHCYETIRKKKPKKVKLIWDCGRDHWSVKTIVNMY